MRETEQLSQCTPYTEDGHGRTSNSNRREILRRFTSESGVGGEDGVQVSKERIGLAVEAAGKLVAVEGELEHLPY